MSRVPLTIPEFNDYINDTDERLQAVNLPGLNKYGIDYGLTVGENAEWRTKRLFWRDTLYPKYINPATSTSVVKQDVKDFMTGFRTFANPLLDKIAVSSIAGNTEEAIFNIDLELDTPTRTGVMSQEPGFKFEPSTHGVHNMRFMNPVDPTSQAMPKGQKVLLERFVGEPNLPVANINFGNAEITARFLHRVDYAEGDTGKTAYYRVTYVNTRGEKGPQSAVFSKVIS